MSKKNKDSSTLFELIAKYGGKVRGAKPADRKEAPQAPDAEKSTAEHAAPAPPAAQPPSQAAEPPTRPAQETPQEVSKAKRTQKKKQASPKRSAKAAAEPPAKSKSAEKTKPQPKPHADKQPAEKAEYSAPLLAAAEQAEKAAPMRMPPGFAPPARLRSKAQAQAEVEVPAISVPSSQFVGLAVAIVLMIATFIVGFTAGRFTAPRMHAEQTPVRTPGKYYLVIQEFTGNTDADQQDAFAIQAFCKKMGYPADVREYKETGLVVLSFEPFDSPSTDEAIQFARKIEKLGLAYQILGGKYRFQQPRTANGSIAPHFEPWIGPPTQ